MKKPNLPSQSNSHILFGSWLVYNFENETIRLHSNTFGKQTIYINEEEVGSFRSLKSSFEYEFEKNGHFYSVKMNTESHLKTENVTTFHKDQSIIQIFKSSFKFTVQQIGIILLPIVLITIVSTIMEASPLVQYLGTFIWLIIAILITGKDYLQIVESDNPNFE